MVAAVESSSFTLSVDWTSGSMADFADSFDLETLVTTLASIDFTSKAADSGTTV